MRCLACNKALSPRESSRKSIQTGEFVDLCTECLQGLSIFTTENPLAADNVVVDDEELAAELSDPDDPFEQVLGG